MTLYQKHVRKWRGCTRCSLYKQRSKIVLARGQVPCNLLFIGEAPGESEDVLGRPFVGPAGKLLDQIIRSADADSLRIAMTNLVACFPREAKASGDNEPPLEAIKTCSRRLTQFVDLCDPDGIILVGKLAHKHAPGECTEKDRAWIEIVHPAAILRADVSQRGLAVQRTVVAIRDLVAELYD